MAYFQNFFHASSSLFCGHLQYYKLLIGGAWKVESLEAYSCLMSAEQGEWLEAQDKTKYQCCDY